MRTPLRRPPCLPLQSLRPNSQFSPSSSPTCSSCCSFLFSLRPGRLHFLRPCSSLKETKKQKTLQNAPNNKAPKSLTRIRNLNPKGDDGDENGGDEGGGLGGESAVKGTILAGLLLVGVIGGFGSVGYFYKDQINAFLTQFSGFIEGNFSRTGYPFSNSSKLLFIGGRLVMLVEFGLIWITRVCTKNWCKFVRGFWKSAIS